MDIQTAQPYYTPSFGKKAENLVQKNNSTVQDEFVSTKPSDVPARKPHPKEPNIFQKALTKILSPYKSSDSFIKEWDSLKELKASPEWQEFGKTPDTANRERGMPLKMSNGKYQIGVIQAEESKKIGTEYAWNSYIYNLLSFNGEKIGEIRFTPKDKKTDLDKLWVNENEVKNTIATKKRLLKLVKIIAGTEHPLSFSLDKKTLIPLYQVGLLQLDDLTAMISDDLKVRYHQWGMKQPDLITKEEADLVCKQESELRHTLSKKDIQELKSAIKTGDQITIDRILESEFFFLDKPFPTMTIGLIKKGSYASSKRIDKVTTPRLFTRHKLPLNVPEWPKAYIIADRFDKNDPVKYMASIDENSVGLITHGDFVKAVYKAYAPPSVEIIPQDVTKYISKDKGLAYAIHKNQDKDLLGINFSMGDELKFHKKGSTRTKIDHSKLPKDNDDLKYVRKESSKRGITIYKSAGNEGPYSFSSDLGDNFKQIGAFGMDGMPTYSANHTEIEGFSLGDYLVTPIYVKGELQGYSLFGDAHIDIPISEIVPNTDKYMYKEWQQYLKPDHIPEDAKDGVYIDIKNAKAITGTSFSTPAYAGMQHMDQYLEEFKDELNALGVDPNNLKTHRQPLFEANQSGLVKGLNFDNMPVYIELPEENA